MSTSNPVTIPPIPSPTDNPASLIQSVWAIKQNIEIAQGTRGVVRNSTLHGPTIVNTQIGAAIRRVTGP